MVSVADVLTKAGFDGRNVATQAAMTLTDPTCKVLPTKKSFYCQPLLRTR